MGRRVSLISIGLSVLLVALLVTFAPVRSISINPEGQLCIDMNVTLAVGGDTQIETCQEYLERRLSEGWEIFSQDGDNVVLLSPDGIKRPLNLQNDVETLRPNAAGDETNLPQSSGCTYHWECVDETSQDGWTTRVGNYTYDTYKRDLYNLPASSGSGTINFIKVYFCVYGDSEHAKPSIKSDSTVTDGTEVSPPNEWTTYSQQWSTNPADSQAWEWSDIDALQIGVSCKADYFLGVYCTQVYVEVDYTPGGCSEDISNTPASYDFGGVGESGTYSTGLSYFTVTNNSGGTIDISIQGTNMSSGAGGCDIEVQHIDFDITSDESTKAITSVSSLNSAFFRNSTARRTSAGPTGSEANTNWNVFCAAAQLTDVDELTGYRAGTQSDEVKMRGEVWEYVGEASGDNEFIVRGRYKVTIASGSTGNTQYISGIVDEDDCVPFVQGVVADLAGVTYGNRVVSYAYIDSSDYLHVERGYTGTEVDVYVVVVEFTGSNWDVGHALLTSPSTGANNVTLYQESDGTGSTFDVGDWDTAFIQGSMAASTTSTDYALEDTWFTAEPHASSTTQATITFDSTAGLTGAEVFIHVIQHDDMDVTRYTDSQSIPLTDDHTVSGLTNLDESALEWYVFTDGGGTAYARGATTAYLTSTTNVAEWTHRTGNTGTYRFGVINLSDIGEAPYVWALSDTATVGSDIYGLKAGLSGGSYSIIVKLNSPYNDLVAGLSDSGEQDWGLQLLTPSTITDFTKGEMEAVVTITATCQ